MPSDTPSNSRDRFLLGAVFIVAAGLRLPRLGWGLPEHFFPDEGTIFVLARRVSATRSLHTGFVAYPPLTTYLLAAVYAVVALARGVPVATLAVPELIWFGRAVMAACSLATVAGTVALGRILGGPDMGSLAGLFLAVVPLHVTQSHVISTDVPMTLFVVLALVAAVRGRAGSSGAYSGLAAGAKYPGGLVVLAPLWRGACDLVRAAWRGERRALVGAAVALAVLALAALGAFTLAFPHWLPDLAAIRTRAAWERFANRDVGNPLARLAPTGLRGTPVVYQLAILLPATLGVPLYLLALVGVVGAARRPGSHAAMLLAFALPYFLFFATSRSVFPRYYLPLVPLLAVAAASPVVTLARRGGVASLAAAALALLAAGHSLALSASLLAHTSVRPQHALRAALARRLAEGRLGVHPRVAFAVNRAGDYTGLRWALAGLPVEPVPLRLERRWLRAERPELVIVAEIDEIVTARNFPGSEASATLEDLARARLPYVLLEEIRVSYLHRALYARLDPYFRVAYERGEMGFRVYGLTSPDSDPVASAPLPTAVPRSMTAADGVTAGVRPP